METAPFTIAFIYLRYKTVIQNENQLSWKPEANLFIALIIKHYKMDPNNCTPQPGNVTTDFLTGDLWSDIEEYTLLNPIVIPSCTFEQNQPVFPLQLPYYPYPNIQGFLTPILPLATVTGDSSIYSQYQQGLQPGGLTKSRRPRLTSHQVDFLEKTFEEIKFPNLYEIECFRLVIDLPERRIQRWFQKRRAKWNMEQIGAIIPEEHGSNNGTTATNFPDLIAGEPGEDVRVAGITTHECSGSSSHLKSCVYHMTPD